MKFVFRVPKNRPGKYVLTNMGWWFIPCNITYKVDSNKKVYTIVKELP